MLVNKNLLGLFNGVSQQPASIRLDSQCELQENAMSSLVDGLYKRPPTELVATLIGVGGSDAGFHTIVRDENEKYFVVFTGDSTTPIEVFDLQGNKQTVQYGHLDEDLVFTADDDVKDYLSCTTPKQDFKATTVADYTIITNKTKTCAMTTTVQDPVVYEAMYYVKNCIQNIDYEITIDGTTVSLASGSRTKTTGIASLLYDKLVKAFSATFNITLKDSCIKISRKNGADFTITAADGWGDMAGLCFKGTAQSMQDLPPHGFDGFVCEIRGADVNTYDNYYVMYTTDEDYKTGVWKESAKLGLCNEIDSTTMPHRLVRTSEGVFTFADIDWADREVGDEDVAAEPSFIGSSINDVFFHKNRLCFISGENVIMSKSGQFWQFFPSTIMDVLDDDPIDVAVSSNQVAVLNYAIPFQKDVVLTSQLQQFVLHASTSGGLTPNNAACDQTTSFETSPRCSPVPAGANLYLAVPAGLYTQVREYFVDSDSLMNDAADVTAHVPNYIPANVRKFAAAASLDMLFALSSDEPRSLYVYKYYWQGTQKAQSAWSKWTFSTDIINMEVMENYLYILTSDTHGIHVEKLNLKKETTVPCSFRIHLDRQQLVKGDYDAVNDWTTFDVGTYYDDADAFVVIDTATGSVIGAQLITGVVPFINNGILTVAGDYRDKLLCIGLDYTMRYQFSEWFMKAQENAANLAGVLKMRKVDLGLVDTGYLKVKVTPYNRDSLEHEFVSHKIGVSKIGEITLFTGTESFLLMCNAKASTVELINDTYLPSEIHAANFEGFYTTRSRLI